MQQPSDHKLGGRTFWRWQTGHETHAVITGVGPLLRPWVCCKSRWVPPVPLPPLCPPTSYQGWSITVALTWHQSFWLEHHILLNQKPENFCSLPITQAKVFCSFSNELEPWVFCLFGLLFQLWGRCYFYICLYLSFSLFFLLFCFIVSILFYFLLQDLTMKTRQTLEITEIYLSPPVKWSLA